ncbi:hypothetical protein GALL_480610 [mine drainage metagenome]|uniref:Uncharacterized protein n=1 Tax=mine drainage metagenome TaxID=410659 RepID=A0A1J5Q375_9ZZZZ
MFRAPVAGGVVSDFLVGQHIAVVIDPCPHTAQAQRDIAHVFKRFDGDLDPFGSGFAVDGDAVNRGAAAPVGGLPDQHDARTGRRGGQRSLQSGDATPNN